MHVVCLILEYFPLNPVHSRYFRFPLKKNNVEGWPEHFCSRLNIIDHEGGEGGGGHHVAKFTGWASYEK